MNGAAMIYPGEGKKGQTKAGDYVLAAEQTRAEAAADPRRSTAVDLARADRWEGQSRTKQLPSTRTEIGAGGELIDREDRWDELGVVDTVADPDYVTASASRERLELASEAGSLDMALDVADSILPMPTLVRCGIGILRRGTGDKPQAPLHRDSILIDASCSDAVKACREYIRYYSLSPHQDFS
jgi:hypothetical protein